MPYPIINGTLFDLSRTTFCMSLYVSGKLPFTNKGEGRMNKTKAAILLGIVLLAASFLAIQANATPAPSEKYFIVTDKTELQLGDSVTATAKALDYQIVKVNFTWIDPAGNPVFKETVNVFTNGSLYFDYSVYANRYIRWAQSTFEPTSMGEWTVKAEFIDEQGWCWCIHDVTVATRTTSFNVVPEVPLLGTAGIAVAMVLGLTVFKKRQKAI
jgi:hypothetical protein